MLAYYKQLNLGLPRDVAMQRAQISYLTDDGLSSPAYRLPMYWGAWMGYGTMAPIADSYNYWYLALGWLGVLLMFWVWRKFNT